jgi:hypothetical protein
MTKLSIVGLFSCTLAACAMTPSQIAEAQTVVTDGEAIIKALEATGTLPDTISVPATIVEAALQSLINSEAATQGTAVTALEAGLAQVANSTTDTQIANEVKAAQDALTAFTAGSGSKITAIVKGATVLIDYLSKQAPATTLESGAQPSATQALINDARAHLAKLQGE